MKSTGILCLLGIVFLPLLAYGSSEEFVKAVKDGDYEQVEQLMDGVDINAKDDSGVTALMYAIWNGHIEIAKLLLERGAEVNVQDSGGWSPLMYAAWKGYSDVAKLMLEKGAGADAKKGDGGTALDLQGPLP